ncbi:methyltransferase type 12 [Prosthecochloris sp. GSB1]|uniref:class I SAM-dependent methyltransferase n=1 Tax=Prosthecochloris sp. GSB1 TaxID=281093 RepID=UPI000B8CBD12|nr:class I SAM-dependent methyltransferase [Prosthecochloris sp. GSB1]ASQ90723.1 methyltransferase type 12 [Prosthecochloris sp. GSB1]
METASCPINGASEAVPFMKAPDRLAPETDSEWSLVRDRETGLIYLSPRPTEEEMALHYPESGYDPHRPTVTVKTLSDRLYLALRHCSLLWKASLIERNGPPLSPDSRLLEIGCSDGGLLDALMKRNGIPAGNCRGYEKSGRSSELARKRFGLDIQTADICDTLPSDSFDRIILWHSLEHLHRLNETLAAVSRLLAPEGRIVIALPNAASLDAALYGRNWVAWDAPRHLYHFTPLTLAKLLRKHGLEVTAMRQFIPDTFYNCLLSEALSFRASGGIKPLLLARGLLRAIRSIVSGIQDRAASSTLVYHIKSTRGGKPGT